MITEGFILGLNKSYATNPARTPVANQKITAYFISVIVILSLR
jgi:hypothetical protein